MASAISDTLLARRGHTRHSSIPRATPSLYGSKNHSITPVHLTASPAAPLTGHPSPSRLPKSKTTNDLSLTKIGRSASSPRKPIKKEATPQRKLLAPLGPPIPYSQALSCLTDSPRLRTIRPRSSIERMYNNAMPTKSQNPTRNVQLNDQFVGIDDDPCLIWFPMPASYWLGRICALKDKYHHEDSFAFEPSDDEFRPSAPRLSEGDFAEETRFTRAIGVIRACCRTPDALESFQHFADEYYLQQRRRKGIIPRSRPTHASYEATKTPSHAFKPLPPSPPPLTNPALPPSAKKSIHPPTVHRSSDVGGLVKSKTIGNLRRLPSLHNFTRGTGNDAQTPARRMRFARRHTDLEKDSSLQVRIPQSSTMPLGPTFSSIPASPSPHNSPPATSRARLLPNTPKSARKPPIHTQSQTQSQGQGQPQSETSSRKSSGAQSNAGTLKKAFTDGVGQVVRRLRSLTASEGGGIAAGGGGMGGLGMGQRLETREESVEEEGGWGVGGQGEGKGGKGVWEVGNFI